MKLVKRIIALLLGMMILFTGFDWTVGRETTAVAENSPSQLPVPVDEKPDELLNMGEWIYWVKDGQAVVAGYEDKGVTSLNIPAHLGGYPVTGVAREAFSTNTALKSIQIPTNVTNIADSAFAGLTGLSIKAYHGAYALEYAARAGYGRSVVGTQPGVEYAEGLVDLTGLPSGSYSKLSDYSVTFKAKEATFLTVGQVVYYPKSAAYPTGLARKIDSITPNGDELIVTQSQPEWGYAFERVSGEDVLILDWDNAVYYDNVDVIDTTAAGVAAKKSLELKTKIGGRELTGSVTFSMDSPTVKYDVGWQWWGLLRIPDVEYVSVTIPMTKKFEVKYGDKATNDKPGTTKLPSGKEIPFGAIPAFSVGGVITGYIQLGFYVELSGYISISATYKDSLNITYKNGRINHSVTPISKDTQIEVCAELKMGPRVKMYVELGWGGFSIKFFEATLGVFLKITGKITYTLVTGTETAHSCGDLKITLDIEGTVKVGLIKILGWDLDLSIGGKITITILTLFNGHFDDGKYVGSDKKCTLKNREYKITSDGKTLSSGNTTVNSYLPEPSTPYKAGHTFGGWYVSTGSSGLPGSDYPFNFKTNRMPYCGENGTLNIYAKLDPIPVTSVTLNKSSETIYTNNQNGVQLTATVKPANAANTSVRWTSSNTRVAKVNSNGRVTPVSAGTATITCASVWNPNIRATFTITVKQYVDSVGLSAGTDEIFQGETLQLSAAVSPNDASDKSLSWSSSNNSIATVNQSGKITGVKSGTAVITATATDRNSVSGRFTVNILLPVTGIELDKASAIIYTNNTTGLQLHPSLTPAEALLASVSWSSSNTNVAKVSNSGVVTPVAPGTATITCRSKSDSSVTDTCVITVKQYVESVAVHGNLASIVAGDTMQFTTTVLPNNATDKSLKWTSSNTSVATVDGTGTITGVSGGSTVITATAKDGSGKSGSYKIVVVDLPANAPAVSVTGVTAPSSKTIYTVNKTAQIDATVSPANADQSVLWASSNENAATIDNTGKITMIRGGTSLLTVRSASDPHKYANVNLRVVQSVETIGFSGGNKIEDIGGTLVLTAIVGPENAEDKSVTWSSSNTAVATIDQNGKVTGLSGGITKITATAKDGSNVSNSFWFKVGRDPIPVESITLDVTSISKYTNEKEGFQLTPTVLPEYADDLSVFWASSDEQVATVDRNGKITFSAPGTTTITCYSTSNPEVTATCTVTVKQYVEQILVNGNKSTLLPGENAQLTATVYPTNASDKTLSWSSSDNAIATVNSNGKVTATGYGTATITATANDGSGASAIYKVEVEKELQLVTSVVNDTVFTQGHTPCDIAYVSLTNASVKRMADAGYELNWTMAKKSGHGDTKMTVLDTTLTQDGSTYLTSIALLSGADYPTAGTEVYTVTCQAGPFTESVDITVTVDGTAYADNVKLTDATVGYNTFTAQYNEDVIIPATPFSLDSKPVPNGMTLDNFGDSYYNVHATETESEDGLSISFDESGVYTSKIHYSKGNLAYDVVATFNMADENGIIRLRVEDISLSSAFLTMAEGDSAEITATISPSDAYDSSVTWTSSDTSVATVNRDGVVSAVAPGIAIITCTAADNRTSAMCTVKVESYLQLDEEEVEYTVYPGGTERADLGIINVTIESEKRLIADGRNITWNLERVSGDNTELGLSEFTSTAEDGISVSGNRIKLLRIKGTGTDVYRLTCTTGNYSDGCTIRVNAMAASLPQEITLNTVNYTGTIGEFITVDTEYTLLPAGAALPENTRVTIDGGNAFWNAMSVIYSYDQPEELIFGVAGTYSGYVIFSGDNYSYRCPFTVDVADEDGIVPPAITKVMIDQGGDPLLMTTSETRTLSVSVEPSNATYSSIQWTSTDTSVATVSKTGKVTAIGPGYTSIVATIPESDYEGTCLIYVEEGINFRIGDLERTVFVDGETRMTLDSIMLTDNTSSRLTKAPEWTLRRVSGISLTLRAEPIETMNTQGMTLYGCNLILYSVSKEGDTIYELTCSNGTEEKTATIVVHAAYRDRMLPASIAADQTVFTADIDELIVVKPMITAYPEDSRLPDGVLVSCEGGKQYQEALNEKDTYVSQSLSTFSFSKAGTFEANLVYAYSNIKYIIPITFNIRDENGEVPVQASRMSLNHRNLYMTIGDSAALEAVFTPVDSTNQAVTWTSSDPSVATVDANGNVRAISNGTAYISCDPADPECETVECAVTVEDYLNVEAGTQSMTLYVQGTQQKNIAAVQLTEGTIERLMNSGVTPVWTVDIDQVNHAEIDTQILDGSIGVLVNTESLKSNGTDTYTVRCEAGEYSWSQDYTLRVVDLGNNAPESVTIRKTAVSTAVNVPVTIDFTPVFTPAGTSMPSGMTDTGFVGVGDFYSAVDMSSYAENGDSITLAFTKPGQYLLTRRYLLSNLQYVTACTITVGGEQTGQNVLKATETSYTVYSGGQSGIVSTVSITDAILYQLWGDSLTWSLERISGDSITAALKEHGDSVDVFVASVEKNGTDVWRVSCSFGGMTESVDLTLTAADPRGELPESIALSTNLLSGMIGNRIYLPLGVSCSPSGSMLPDQGDEFWSFEFDQAGEERSSHSIENGMLQVLFTMSGYYTGTLTYRSGNVSYQLPVYFVIQDEEQEVREPEFELFAINTADTVYPEGETGVSIGQMVMAESLSTYSTGSAVAYMKTANAVWKVTTSGTAATLSLRKASDNVYDLVLNQIKKSGDLTYTVTCTIDGKNYTVTKTLHVAGSTEARPDATLAHTMYQTTVGEEVTIDNRMYSREDGSILQSSTELDASALLAAAGYEINEKDSGWKMTFYQEGTYNASVHAQVSNLMVEVPIQIIVSEKGSEIQLTVFKLPAALTTIEEEAFEGISANVIDLRGTKIKTIGAGAFKNSVDVRTVYLPNSVRSIADDAFYGCLNAQFCCEAGSYAATWAADHHFTVIDP